VYMLQDALLDLQRADAQRPPFNLLPAIEIWIEAQVMSRIAVLEARKRHLDEEPELVANLRAQRDRAVQNGVYQVAVANVPPPGPELVRLAWERVKGQFARLDTAHVAVLEVADSALAAHVSMLRGSAASLADAAKQVNPPLAVTERAVPYPNADPEWSPFRAMFTQQEPGTWFGPERRPGGWRLIQLVGKATSEQAFEDLPQALQQNIAGNAAELARDARFKQFMDSLSAALHPIVDHALAARLPWPPPPPLDVGR